MCPSQATHSPPFPPPPWDGREEGAGEPSPHSSLLGEQEERNEAGVSGCSCLPLLPRDSRLPAFLPMGLSFGGWGEKLCIPQRQ